MKRIDFERIGLVDEEVLFLTNLNELKNAYYLNNVQNNESDDKLSNLSIYNKLLNICDLVDNQFRYIDEDGFSFVKLLFNELN